MGNTLQIECIRETLMHHSTLVLFASADGRLAVDHICLGFLRIHSLIVDIHMLSAERGLGWVCNMSPSNGLYYLSLVANSAMSSPNVL